MPPLVLAADAVTLGKMTDGVLLITRPGVVENDAATAKESLERSGQNVLGLVVNGVILETNLIATSTMLRHTVRRILQPVKGYIKGWEMLAKCFLYLTSSSQ